jgi:hypothetical protein
LQLKATLAGEKSRIRLSHEKKYGIINRRGLQSAARTAYCGSDTGGSYVSAMHRLSGEGTRATTNIGKQPEVRPSSEPGLV